MSPIAAIALRPSFWEEVERQSKRQHEFQADLQPVQLSKHGVSSRFLHAF